MTGSHRFDITVDVPFNADMEHRVIAMTLATGGWGIAAAEIEPALFFDPLCRDILARAAAQVAEGRPATSVTLAEYFRNEPDIGGMSFADFLFAAERRGVYLDKEELPEYVRQLKEQATQRGLLSIGVEIIEALRSNPMASMDVANTMYERLGALIAERAPRRRSRVTIAEAASAAMQQAFSPDKRHIVPTGYTDLDRALGGGFRRGEFIVAAARPSMGKSALFAAIALRAAQRGRAVLYLSLEMTSEAFGERCLTDVAWDRCEPIAYKDLRSGACSEADARRLYAALKQLDGVPLYLDDTPGLRVGEIAARARRLMQHLAKDGRTLDLLVIDHLGKVPAARPTGRSYEDRSEVSGALAALAKQLEVPLVALHQLSRGPDSREEKRPGLSDLRDSGKIEEDADTVLFVYREAYYLERTAFSDPEREAGRLAMLETARNRLEVILAKQRAGDTGIVTLFADMGSNAIRDHAAE